MYDISAFPIEFRQPVHRSCSRSYLVGNSPPFCGDESRISFMECAV